MLAETEVQEYLDEIRQQVCSRCVERPYGGPPCGPLGKPCGVEMHLPQLIEATREVHSDLIQPYLENNRRKICEGCAFLHSEFCPCPMDNLAVLVVEAIESVDRRRRRREEARERLAAQAGADRPGLEDVARACEEALGTWTGCDWPTTFGRAGLDLNGWTAAEAETRAVEAAGAEDREDWTAAAQWLREVERRAAQAESRALQAVAAARKGVWTEAVENARRAWALEFQTGRTLRRQAPTWQRLYKLLRVIAPARGELPAAE